MRLSVKILRHVRCKVNGKEYLPLPDFAGYEFEFVRYHVGLCKEAGLLPADLVGIDEFDDHI